MSEIVDPTEVQIAKYLALGYKPSQVAQIFALSPSHISYLQNKEGFKELVASQVADSEKRALEIDDRYEDIEALATTKIHEKLRQGFYKPSELLAIATMANKATKKRGNAHNDGSQGSEQIYAKITLPAGLVGIEIVRTPDNQVTRVGQTSLAPVSRQTLDKFAGIEDAEIVESKTEPDYTLPSMDDY